MGKLVISFLYFLVVTFNTWILGMIQEFQDFFYLGFSSPCTWSLVWEPAPHPGCQLRLPPAHTHVLLPLQSVLCGHVLHLHHHKPKDATEHPDTEPSQNLWRCISQMYFILLFVGMDDFLLTVMAYDRYVAICHPLHCTAIMNPQLCRLLVVVSWIMSVLNSLLHSLMVLGLSICSNMKSPPFSVNLIKWSNLPVLTLSLITWWCILQLHCWLVVPSLGSFTHILR